MVAGFITALQSAVLAIETELGTAAARNYIRKDGAVTVTGLKTFQDGAEFGAGTKSSTGLVRLPNAGAVKWRKQDNSGDLGIALEREQPPRDGRHHRLRGGPDVRREHRSGRHDARQGRRADRPGWRDRRRGGRRSRSPHPASGLAPTQDHGGRHGAAPRLARRSRLATCPPTPTRPPISSPARSRSRSRTTARRSARAAR